MAPALREKRAGLVAILDALGAADYSDHDIAAFVRSRQTIIDLLNEKAEAILGEIKKESLSTFTFNDTVLILYHTEHGTAARDVKRFFTLLRKFIVDSLVQGILFRGSVAIGSYYVNDSTNTVLGRAVSDAAAWYDRADWIGVHATPHASILIESLDDYDAASAEYVIAEYPVPFKEGGPMKLKVVNWPKGFFVSNVTPCIEGEDAKRKVRSLLSKHQIPSGTQSKYFNTIAFFDHIADAMTPRKTDAKRSRPK